MASKSTRSEKLDIRLTADAKTLLQQAAEAKHKTVSEFVLDSALGAAHDALKDHNVFALDAEHWAAFVRALDAPPRRHPRLQRLLTEPSRFD